MCSALSPGKLTRVHMASRQLPFKFYDHLYFQKSGKTSWNGRKKWLSCWWQNSIKKKLSSEQQFCRTLECERSDKNGQTGSNWQEGCGNSTLPLFTKMVNLEQQKTTSGSTPVSIEQDSEATLKTGALKLDSCRLEKHCLVLGTSSNIQMTQSRFSIRSMNAWTQPALCQQFRWKRLE